MSQQNQTIYNFSCYRKYLSYLVDSTKTRSEKITFTSIAEALQIHRSTFSKVMGGDMDLNSDAVYLLRKYLNLSSEESDYLQLLVDKTVTNLPSRREEIEESIRVQQRERFDTAKALEAKEVEFDDPDLNLDYYSSPWPPLVHIFLTVAKYQANPDLIADVLGISKIEFERALRCLKDLKLIRPLDGKKLMAESKLLHPAKKDRLVHVQQMLIRGVMTNRLCSTPLTERYGLSVSFSADENTREEVRQRLIAAVADIQKKVTSAKAEKVFHLSIDLLRVDD